MSVTEAHHFPIASRTNLVLFDIIVDHLIAIFILKTCSWYIIIPQLSKNIVDFFFVMQDI